MHQNVLQDCIVVGSNEIEEVKEYINLGHMVNICLWMDAEILWGIRSEWKAYHDITYAQGKCGQDPTCWSLQ